MALLNPLGINAPTTPHTETDYRVPTVNSNVGAYPVGRNPMSLTWPIPTYTQPNIAPPAVKIGGKLL